MKVVGPGFARIPLTTAFHHSGRAHCVVISLTATQRRPRPLLLILYYNQSKLSQVHFD